MLGLCLLLTSCGGGPVRKPVPPPTLSDLSPRPGGEEAQLTGSTRDKAIAAYLDYLQRYPASGERNRVMRRVADLLLERAADTGAVVPTSRQIAAAAQTDYTAAIDLYRRLLASRPGPQENTRLRYQLARAYEESGQAARATDELQQLVQLDQAEEEAKLYTDAQFRRGELLFAEGSFETAEQAYRAVLQTGNTVPVYRQARYKLAWTLFKLARYDAALALFFAVVDSSIPIDADPGPHFAGLSPAEQEQLNDLFRGISLCFFHLSGADSVDAYFQRHGDRGYQVRVYRDLAELYVAKEFFSDAARTYLALARRTPLAPASARLYIEVIALYRQAGLSQQVLQAQAALVRDYGMNELFRTHHPLQTLPDLVRELQSGLAALARHDHARALDSGAAGDYRSAEQWYRTYLQLFPDSKEAPQMNLGLAAAYYDSGQYGKAAIEYENTAYSRGEHPAAARAGRLALKAQARHLDSLDQAQRERWSSRSTASSVRFLEAFPEHADAPAILAGTGVKLLERGQAEQAIQLGQQLLQQALPPSTLRPVAWSLIGQAHLQRGGYQAAEQAFQKALASTTPGDPQYLALRKGLAVTLYKQAEQSHSRGEAADASSLFQRAADTSPDPAIRAQARYDAAAELLAMGQWQQAARALGQFRADHPDHPLWQEASRKLAFAYEQGGREIAAAQEYLRLGSSSADQELRRQALMRASDLYRQGGNIEAAIDALQYYMEDFQRPPERLIEIYQRLAELYRASGDEQQHRHWLVRVVDAYKGARETADRHSRTLAARASLELAGQQSAAFQRITLVEPLQTTLRAKLQALRSAIEAFEQAKSYNVPAISSAATYQIAGIYLELSLALQTSERPAGLNTEEMGQYNRLLYQQAAPFRSKAIEIDESNLKRIAEGYYDDWIGKSLQRLTELWPLRYAKEERGEPFVESLR
jgi:tetratricopeptide (TPR) repeat protein